MESLNQDPNWLKKITIEIDNFLVDCEYINVFVKMCMQWTKDNSSASSYQTFIIPCLPRFEKLALSQFKVYIESQIMTQWFVFRNYKKIILTRDAEVKEEVFLYFTHVKDPYWFVGVS